MIFQIVFCTDSRPTCRLTVLLIMAFRGDSCGSNPIPNTITVMTTMTMRTMTITTTMKAFYFSTVKGAIRAEAQCSPRSCLGYFAPENWLVILRGWKVGF